MDAVVWAGICFVFGVFAFFVDKNDRALNILVGVCWGVVLTVVYYKVGFIK